MAATSARLARAEALVAQASQAGAQVVVLPEAFNTGYAYTEANFALAEPRDGITCVWMKGMASQYAVHLAGALMLVEDQDIYMSFLLFSPAGEMWRYDKPFPWAWEHGYFRKSAGKRTVAHTELGDFGMLICWDVGHCDLWKQYAGEVDMMLVSSCPVGGSDPVYHFPDGGRLTLNDLGPFFAPLKGAGRRVFTEMLDAQIAWLGVPCVSSVESGEIRTPIPRGVATLFSIVPMAPWTARYLPLAGGMEMSCRLAEACKVLNADGRIAAARAEREGEGIVLAEVALPQVKPAPSAPQPAAPLPRLSYLLADVVIPSLMRPVYKEGVAGFRTRQ